MEWVLAVVRVTTQARVGDMREQDISGSGGKGGGGSAFFEADDTLKSTAVVRVVEVVSEGEVVGVVNGRKGVYLNNVPVQNQDGTENFGGNVAFQERVGLPDQPSMSGFPSATAEFSIGTQITNASGGVVYTTLSDTPRIDALRVTIGLNDGLAYNDTSTNELKGTEVDLAIERRLGAGTWVEVKQIKIRGKATSVYEESHRIERPLGTGTWSIRVKRLTADNSSATLKNNTFLARVAEIQDVTLTYENTAYVGLAVDARSVASSSVPTRSYQVKGIKVKVPSNYTVATRTYSGQWNGLFKTAFEWTDNPAWILYDFLCHPRYGLGAWVTEDLVDKYSFYNAAVYNDELVNKYDQDGNLLGQEPRFTFNYQLMARQDANKWLQDIAGMMNAKLVWLGNKATLVQDRPASVSRLVTNSNVVDGKFTYKSTSQQDRITAVLVTWNNPDSNYFQETVVVDKNTTRGTLQTLIANAEAKYGYNSDEIVALGCTSEHQARRAGAWKLDTALSQTEIVNFRMFVNGYDLFPGEIISLFDQDYAGVQLAGKLLAGATTTSLPLDRSVTISAGATISVMLPNGTIETKTVTQGAGTYSTLTASTALSAAPNEYADFIVTSAVSPRQFKVTKTTLDQEGYVQLEAVLHDPNKYSRVETGNNAAAPIFSDIASPVLSAPTSLLFKEVSVNIDNTIVRSLNISWQRPTDGVVSYYRLQWQVNSGGWQSIDCLAASAELANVMPGLYEVRVAAFGVNGIAGPEVKGSYTISVVGGGASSLSAVTNLVANPGGATTFTGSALTVKWTNPSGNASVTTATIRDFEVRVLTSADVLLRTEYVPAVPAGSDQQYTYTFDANMVDGGPRRTVKVSVRIRDANNNLSTATTVQFTNAAPSALTLTVSPGYQSNTVKWSKPSDADYAGVLVWASTSNGFTPGAGNLVFDGDASAFNHGPLADATTWYYKAAAYDQFGKDSAGTGLNLSTQASGTTLSGIAQDEWMLEGVTWTPNSPGTNQVAWSACTSIKTAGSGQGGTTAISAGNATWTSGILYIYHVAGQATLSSTTNLATALSGPTNYVVATYRGGTNLQVGDGRAYTDGGLIIAGTVGASQMVTGLLSSDNVLTRGLTVRDNSGNVILSSGQNLDWTKLGGNKPIQYRVVAYGANAGGPSWMQNLDTGQVYTNQDGQTGTRSYNVAVFNRSTGALVSLTYYDVFGSGAMGGLTAASMASALNALTSSYIVVVFTYDEPEGHRTDSGLPAALYRCGASPGIFGRSDFKYRSAYLLIGIPGCGQGNGFEMYRGDVDHDTNAIIDASFTIQNGQFNVSGTGSQPVIDGGNADTYLKANIGGANRAMNSSFEWAYSATKPWGWATYNAYGTWAEVRPAGRLGGYGFGIKCTGVDGNVPASWAFGILVDNTIGPNTNDYWTAYKTYTVSFYAKKVNGAGLQAMTLNWNTQPAQQIGVSNPNLTTDWQRYVFRVVWGASAEGSGGLFISVNNPGSRVVNDEVWFDDVQVEEGEVVTAWKESYRDTISGARPINSSNVSTYIASGAIGNAYIGNFIQSTDFNGTIDGNGNITADGTVGWAIAKGNGASGKAVFQNVKVRGDVQATSVSTTIASTLASAQYSSGGYVSWPNSAAVWDPYPASSALASSAALYLEAGWVILATATYSADLQFRSTNSPESCGMHVQLGLWSCNSGGTLNAIQAYAFHPHRLKNFWYSNSTAYVLANFPGSFTHMFKITSAGYYRLTLSLTNVYAWDVNSNVVAPGATSTLYTTTNYIGYTIIKI